MSEPVRVAVELTALALPAVTRRPRSALLDPVVRAAVLIDLALDGALVQVRDGLEIDTTATGFAPADQLLDAVTERPDRALVWWLYNAPITVHDTAGVLVDAGRWERYGPWRRYRDLDPDRTTADRTRLVAALQGDYDPAQAVTATLLAILRPAGWPSPAFAADRCGPANWLMPDLEASLRRRQATLDASASDARNAASSSFII